MSTTDEPGNGPASGAETTDLEKISSTTSVTPIDRSAANLERLYQSERDGRKKDQFYFILGVAILVDGYVAQFAGHGFLLIFLLQIAALLGLAKHLEVSTIIVPLENLFNVLMNRIKGRKGREDE